MPLPAEKVRTLHPHLNLRNPARQPATATAAPIPAPAPNPVHATMDQLAAEIGADKSPAEDYILGGSDAPELTADPIPLATKYPATESYRPLEQQPMAQPAAEKKSGWGFFGRKKAADLRTEPMPERAPEPRIAAPRATAQTMPQPQSDAQRAKDDDLFPDHKRDEQFEIPAFLRRQSN